MNEDQERRSRIASKIEQIGIEITGLLERIDNDPELARALTDAELLSLDAWKDAAHVFFRGQCRNRRAATKNRPVSSLPATRWSSSRSSPSAPNPDSSRAPTRPNPPAWLDTITPRGLLRPTPARRWPSTSA